MALVLHFYYFQRKFYTFQMSFPFHNKSDTAQELPGNILLDKTVNFRNKGYYIAIIKNTQMINMNVLQRKK